MIIVPVKGVVFELGLTKESWQLPVVTPETVLEALIFPFPWYEMVKLGIVIGEELAVVAGIGVGVGDDIADLASSPGFWLAGVGL